MNYSIIAILSVMVLLIINSGVLFRRGDERFPAERYYRRFLLSVIAYLLTDVAWGLLYENGLITAAYIDTMLYFITMALSVLFWTIFVVRYLGEKTRFGTILKYTGWALLILQVIELTINLFEPIAFYFDDEGAYHTSAARYASLGLLVIMFLMSFVFTLVVTAQATGAKKRRYLTVGLFGLSIGLLAALQMYFPLWPVYAIGCLLGVCVLHTFVVEEEKAAYLFAAEQAHVNELMRQKELDAAKNLLYTDPLSGVNSKHAYLRAAERIDDAITHGQQQGFALAVFDLNNLKSINDTMGHEAGDKAIVEAGRLISEAFADSAVYRIGGDEFVVLLEGYDYEARDALTAGFERLMDDHLRNGTLVISYGISAFRPGSDSGFADVFARADKEMYHRKSIFKLRSEDQSR